MKCGVCGNKCVNAEIVTYNNEIIEICKTCVDHIETDTNCRCCKCGRFTKPFFIYSCGTNYKIYCILCSFKL